MTTAPTDPVELQKLVRLAQGGCRDSYGVVVHRLHDGLFQFLLVRVGDAREAEELTHESFVRAWVHLDRYRTRWRFSTWLYTIARRLAVTHHRDRGRRAVALETETVAPDGEPHESLGERELCHNVWTVARRVLNPEQVSALWLRYAEGRDCDEVGRVLGKRPTAIRVLLHRARRKLAAQLTPEPDVPLSALRVPAPVARSGGEA